MSTGGFVKKLIEDGVDIRYGVAQMALENGKIKEFNQIFDYIPKTCFCKDVGMTGDFFNASMRDISKWKLDYFLELASKMGVSEERIMLLAIRYWRDHKDNPAAIREHAKTRRGNEEPPGLTLAK